jgi:ribosomal protein S12 methylthiotransferase
MKRPAHAEDTLARICQWRNLCPDLALRSTFIVGFPGETEAEFQELLDWLKAAQLDRVGCFAYSNVEGAAANNMPGQVPEDVKQERYARFMELAADISAARLQQKIGQEMQVLVDEIDTEEGVIIARSKADAPEIDGNVFIERDDLSGVKPGDLLTVRITDANEYDLFAE